METKKRSLLKAVIWNVFGLASMALVGYLATGSVSTGGKIAVINTMMGFSLYLFYERVWAKISWGRNV
ncbi:MAG: DUF2061 domain-containing protein [Paracoccaceae bacterium]